MTPQFRVTAHALAMIAFILAGYFAEASPAVSPPSLRERVSLNANWRFQKGDPENVDSRELLYDVRPELRARGERPAEFTETAEKLGPAGRPVLKPYILPTGNVFIKDPARRFTRPQGNPGGTIPYVRNDFDDGGW